MAESFSHWLFYHVGAGVYEKVLGAWTLGHWWRWQQRVLEHLPREGVVLELGCGTGRLLQQCRMHRNAVGIDMSVPMLKQANQRLGPGAPVLAANGGCLPFPDNTFSAAYSTGVLTAIPDIRPIMRELQRVVKPGGSLAFVEMMPPQRKTARSAVTMAALRAVRDQFHDIPGLLAEIGATSQDEELGRAGTVHLITGTLPLTR